MKVDQAEADHQRKNAGKKDLHRLACLRLVFSTALSAMVLGASAAEQPVSSKGAMPASLPVKINLHFTLLCSIHLQFSGTLCLCEKAAS